MKNIAIIGCGSIAKRHAKWANHYGKLVAVCDIKPERAISLARQYGCEAYTDFKRMLSDKDITIDLVAICTPNGLHAKHTIAALDFGCNVLCEKPMATTLSECEDMIYTSMRTHRSLFVVKQNRFNLPVQLVKKALDENQLGKILSVHLNCAWAREDEYYEKSDWKGTYLDGGILHTQFSHFIDLMSYLIDAQIVKAKTFSQNFIHKDTTLFPDTVATTFKFDNGTIGTAHFTINSYKDNMEGSLTIFGEKGTVKLGGKYLNTIEYQNIKNYAIPLVKIEGNANDYGAYQGSSSNHNEVYKNVINILLNKKGTVANMWDGRNAVKIIEMILNAE